MEESAIVRGKGSQRDGPSLDDALVITVRKGFWASPECELFPRRLYATQVFGYSQKTLNTAITFLRALAAIAVGRPRLVFFGSSHRVLLWFARLKARGWFRDLPFIATNQVQFSDQHARHIERIIVYSTCEGPRHHPSVRDRYVFMPLPADLPIKKVEPVSSSGYVFSGSGPSRSRDFSSLIEAVRGLPVKLVIVTFSPYSLGYDGELPENVEVIWKVPVERYVEIMAGALFVVIPLQAQGCARGHTSIVQALSLGKPVITTADATVDDYVRNGREGFVVAAGDIIGYRSAIQRLLEDEELREDLARNALAMARECTYEAFAARVDDLCREVLRESTAV